MHITNSDIKERHSAAKRTAEKYKNSKKGYKEVIVARGNNTIFLRWKKTENESTEKE